MTFYVLCQPSSLQDNDPPGQSYSYANNEHENVFCFDRLGKIETNGRTTCVNILVVTVGRPSGSTMPEESNLTLFFICVC